MSLFGGGGNTSFGNTANFSSSLSGNHNPMKDVEVSSPPDDSVSSLSFSPACLSNTFLIAGSWDNNVSVVAIRIHILLKVTHHSHWAALLKPTYLHNSKLPSFTGQLIDSLGLPYLQIYCMSYEQLRKCKVNSCNDNALGVINIEGLSYRLEVNSGLYQSSVFVAT